MINTNAGEYTSFPETLSPTRTANEDFQKKIGFFGEFASHLATLPRNYVDLLKMLSDGIADLLFAGSTRFETRAGVN